MENDPSNAERLLAALEKIAEHCVSLPVLDGRTPEEILGYDEHGLPGQARQP